MINFGVEAGVAQVTLNAPANRNALSVDLMRELSEALDRAAHDRAVRVVVLAGAGPAFCSGADISAVEAGTWADGPARYVGLLSRILDHPKPTIARVQGHVAGGGNGLVAACDLAVAVASATFAFSEVRLGAVPAVVAVPVLARMHSRDVQELMLLGGRVDARRARSAGLLTQVVDDETALDEMVRGWAAQLLAAGPEALRRTKEVLRRVPDLERGDAFAWTEQVATAAFGSAEAAEGIAAWRARRAPSWVPSAKASVVDRVESAPEGLKPQA